MSDGWEWARPTREAAVTAPLAGRYRIETVADDPSYWAAWEAAFGRDGFPPEMYFARGTEWQRRAERLFPTDEIREKMLSDIPGRRFTTLDDVVASALFLLSDDASNITGETLTVDGGQALGQGMFRHSPIPQR